MSQQKPRTVPFGPIRLTPDTVAELKSAAVHRTQASIVRELVELWAEARKKQKVKV